MRAAERLLALRWRWFLLHGRIVQFAKCLRGDCGSISVHPMNTTDRRLVLVPADQLDDLLELARVAVDRLPDDQLSRALRGQISEVRVSALMEP